MSPSMQSQQNQMPRREFLRASLLLPLALTPLAQTRAVLAASAPSPLSAFGIGYMEPQGVQVVNAGQIKQGDALFQHTGVRLRISGFNPDSQSESKTTGAQIVAIRSFVHFYPALPGQPAILVPAWSSEVQMLQTGDTVLNLVAPVCMTAPLSPDGSLVFSVSVRRANSIETTRMVRLTTGRGQDAKLRRGTYFVAAEKTAIPLAEWNAPAWQDVVSENDAPSPGNAENRSDPDFPFLIVRVNHAANSMPSTLLQRS